MNNTLKSPEGVFRVSYYFIDIRRFFYGNYIIYILKNPIIKWTTISTKLFTLKTPAKEELKSPAIGK